MGSDPVRRRWRARQQRLRSTRAASTVVIAGVAAAVALGVGLGLYFYFAHSQSSPGSSGATIGFLPASAGAVGSTFFDNFSLEVHGNVSTAAVGFELVSATGNTLAAGSAIDRCSGEYVSSCAASSLGWYVALTDSTGRILALYDAELWNAPALNVLTGDHVVIVADYPLAGSSSHFLVVATGNTSISGSTLL